MDASIKEDYEILGLEPGATVEEIRQKYKNLHRVWGSDTFQGEPHLSQKAQSKINELDRAYEELLLHLLNAQPVAKIDSEPEKSSLTERAHYDSINHSEKTMGLSEQQAEMMQVIDTQQTSQEDSPTQPQQQEAEWYYYNYGWKGPCSLTILQELYSKHQINENTLVKGKDLAAEIELKDSILFEHFKDILSRGEQGKNTSGKVH